MERRSAYRVETERLVLRCYEIDDCLAIGAGIRANLEHLRPTMPWVRDEPLSDEARLERLRTMRDAFDGGEDFVYGIFDRDGKFIGGTGLHPRVGPGAIEIGYWIDRTHEGRGLVTEAAGALTRVAIEIHGLVRVEIRCDPRNVRSAAVPERLGYTHVATLLGAAQTVDGAPRDTMVWSLFDRDLASSPAARIEYTAFDATGRTLAA